MKKKLVIVLGATGNMSFAVANVLMGLEQCLENTNFDIIIYHDNKFKANDIKLLNSIIPSKFIEYKYPASINNFTDFAINRYTEIAFSRYECFNLLDEYENVLWLDIDILIKKDILPLIEECEQSVGACKISAPVNINFTKKINNYDMDIDFFNSGVLLFKDTLPNYKIFSDWCYSKTNELAPILICPDQGIINLLFQEFNICVYDIKDKYNCHPRKINIKDPVILHTYCPEKFWDFYDNPFWQKNYDKWLKMGGSSNNGRKPGFFEKQFKLRFHEAPNPLKYPKGFIKYLKNYSFIKDFFINIHR